jgi:hypothetical protein
VCHSEEAQATEESNHSITFKLLTYNNISVIISIQSKGAIFMPVISRFYGMIVKMYFIQSEHNPPHIHVMYGEYLGIIDLRTLEMLEGDLPDKAFKIAKEWTKLHQQELIQMWETQNIKPLPPIE